MTIKEFFDIKKENAITFLDDLCRQKKVEKFYQVRCPACNLMIQEKYKNEQDIPEETECDSCGSEIKDPWRYKEVIYMVL